MEADGNLIEVQDNMLDLHRRMKSLQEVISVLESGEHIALWLGHYKNEGNKTTRKYIHKDCVDGWKELVADIERLAGMRVI